MHPDTARKSILRKIEYDTNGGCWLWRGKTAKNGYGIVAADADSSVLCTGAHRRAYELFVGPIPSGKHVCHRCDVRCCVNPDHLFLGTARENIADMDRKGRRRTVSPRGPESGMSKLNEKQVLKIRELYASGDGLSGIGRLFSVTPQNIRSIVLRKTWSHV